MYCFFMGLSNWRTLASDQDAYQTEVPPLCSSSPWLAFFHCFCRSMHGQSARLWFTSRLQFTEFPTVKFLAYSDGAWYRSLKTRRAQRRVALFTFDSLCAFVYASFARGAVDQGPEAPCRAAADVQEGSSTCSLSYRRVSVDMMV